MITEAQAAALAARNYKHGLSKTPEWRHWAGILRRCRSTAPENDRRVYFDKGITVCERWKFFPNFIADMGPRPVGMSIERKDNTKGYQPGNCRWATAKEQARNTAKNTWLSFEGQSMILQEWAELRGWPRHIISNRLRYGWTVERALTVEPAIFGPRSTKTSVHQVAPR